MKKIKRKSEHGLKTIRRFDEDIWITLAKKKFRIFKKERIRLYMKKYYCLDNGSKVLFFLYEAYQNNFKYRKLLKGHKRRFFFKKKEKFKYKIVTGEKEYRRKMRTIKIRHYLNKLKLRRFYGNISEKKIKRLFFEASLNSNFLGKSFLSLLESRLDVLLYRSKIFNSIFSARQHILHKGVYIDGALVHKSNYKVNLFSFVSIKNSNNLYKKIKEKLKKKKFFGNYPSYLEVNYKLGMILFYRMPSMHEVPFPFFLNYKHLVYSFFK